MKIFFVIANVLRLLSAPIFNWADMIIYMCSALNTGYKSKINKKWFYFSILYT